MNLSNRKDIVFLILAGFFITNAVVAELIAGKLFVIGPINLPIIISRGEFVMSLGIMLWPIVFLTTDLVNEYYGRKGVRTLSLITVGLIGYMFCVITIGLYINAPSYSPVSNDNYKSVFGPSQYIIIGSILAFLSSQLVDVFIFWVIRDKTGNNLIWLRATGSTVVSQLIDTFVVQYIGFVIPELWTIDTFLHNATNAYIFKLAIALILIPIIYLVHHLVKLYIGENEIEKQIKEAAEAELGHKETK